MAYSFRIDTAQGVVLFKGAEIFSISDILNCLEEIEADPAFKPEFDHLVDMREVANFGWKCSQLIIVEIKYL